MGDESEETESKRDSTNLEQYGFGTVFERTKGVPLPSIASVYRRVGPRAMGGKRVASVALYTRLVVFKPYIRQGDAVGWENRKESGTGIARRESVSSNG